MIEKLSWPNSTANSKSSISQDNSKESGFKELRIDEAAPEEEESKSVIFDSEQSE